MHFSLKTLLSLAVVFNLVAQQKICEVSHPDIDEQSAIIKSQTYEDVYWVCNDSGKKPYLYPLNSKGEMIVPDYIARRDQAKSSDDYPGIKLNNASLIDWEAMTLSKDTLFIADVGNNGNARRDQGVYLVLEPNPRVTVETRPLAWLPVRFEDQSSFPPEEWEFDCESMFVFKGKLYFLTKHRANQHINKPASSTKLYRMDTRYTHQVNVLKRISRREDLGGWITDASMAPDESAMVMLAQNPLISVIWYFPTPKRGDDFLSQSPRSFNLKKSKQAEGICFKNAESILVTNEQREWYEIPLSAFNK